MNHSSQDANYVILNFFVLKLVNKRRITDLKLNEKIDNFICFLSQPVFPS